MHLYDYQTAAARTINHSLSEEGRLMDAAAGLAEEAGEVLGLVRKTVYQNRVLDRGAVVEELGDVLWCLAIAAGTLGVSLEEVAWRNLEKLGKRYPAGFSEDASAHELRSP